MAGIPFDLQLLNLLRRAAAAAAFAMLAQRRILTLVNLLAVQGALLFVRDAAARLAHAASLICISRPRSRSRSRSSSCRGCCTG